MITPVLRKLRRNFFYVWLPKGIEKATVPVWVGMAAVIHLSNFGNCLASFCQI